MKKYKSLTISLIFILIALGSKTTCSTNRSTTVLKQYKQFLEKGTYSGQDYSHFKVRPKSRYHTFKKVFAHFEKNNGKIIVELGTTRSFVTGGLPGCLINDPRYWQPKNPEVWDWGAGCFTRLAAECLHHLNPTIYTIDISTAALQISKTITADFQEIMRYHRCSSLDFLRICNFGIDLLYLDTGNLDEQTARLQFQEAQIIVERGLLADNGLILIDDVKNPAPRELYGDTSGLGKSKYALPYLLNNGFEIVADEYQVILKKTK